MVRRVWHRSRSRTFAEFVYVLNSFGSDFCGQPFCAAWLAVWRLRLQLKPCSVWLVENEQAIYGAGGLEGKRDDNEHFSKYNFFFFVGQTKGNQRNFLFIYTHRRHCYGK